MSTNKEKSDTNSKKRGIFQKILIVILSVIAALILLLVLGINIYTKVPAMSAYSKSKGAFIIPYSNKGYIAQGLAYDKKSDNFYLTGYMKDGSASPIFIVNRKTKKLVNAVRMANPDGSDYCGHAGGLSIMNDKIYVAGSEKSCFYVFEKAELDNAKKDSYIAYTETINLAKNSDVMLAAYTTVCDDMIFAGEFYRDIVYVTPENHKVNTKDGLQYAIAVGYKLKGNEASPEIVYSVPNQIQGMCFSDDKIYLTSSWGLSHSKVYVYDRKSLVQAGSKEVCGKMLPLYELTLENLEKSWTLPPMAEEIEFVDGKLYISNESASDKYIFGKLTGGQWCRAYNLD
ncbi:MAG: hypothetical protein K5829_11420 [Treponema sp.]|nr:hypothetical protein [Treponema sp.]